MRMSVDQEFAVWEGDLGDFLWCAVGLGHFRDMTLLGRSQLVLSCLTVLLHDCCCCRGLLIMLYPWHHSELSVRPE